MLALTAGDIDISVSIQRDGKMRRRSLQVTTDRGLAEIDFATEPGLARVNGRASRRGDRVRQSARAGAVIFPKSLVRCGRSPLHQCGKRSGELLFCRRRRSGFIRAQQASAIRAGVRHGASVAERDSAVFALKEWIAGERGSGRGSADDEQAARKALQWLTNSKSGHRRVNW